MNFKFILKTLSFSLVTPFVLASETNDCNEIKEYITKTSSKPLETVIEKCIVNDQGKVIELKINNYDLKEEDIDKVLSYNTIKDLKYEVRFDLGETEREYARGDFLPHKGYSGFPSAFTKLPELESLYFRYNHIDEVKYFSYSEQIPIDAGFLKLSKTIKKLGLSQIKLNSQNLEEISTLTNLEEIGFDICLYDNNGLSPLENNTKLSKLTIKNIFTDEKPIPNNINKLKSLKQIYISNSNCNGKSYDFKGLDNLENLFVEIENKCDFDFSNDNKLSDLRIKGGEHIMSYPGIDEPISIKLPDSIKNLELDYLIFTSDNIDVISSLPNLESLILYPNFNSVPFNKSIPNPEKLRKLVLAGSQESYEKLNGMIGENLDILNDLVNLTYLDIRRNDIKSIPQLENLKKLEHLDLSENNLVSIPKQLKDLKNLEYIDLSENDIYDKIPEYLNDLENLKFFNIVRNKGISGKVLTNKKLETCVYSKNYNICIPKGYELKCLPEKEKPFNIDNYHLYSSDTPDQYSFKICEEDNEENIEVGTDNQCGEGRGKCPSGQCCNKDGKCGTTDDFCLMSKSCQIKYGNCKDECEEIYDQIKKINDDRLYNIVECSANNQGRAVKLVMNGQNQKYIDQLVNLSDLETLTINDIENVENFKSLNHNKNLTSLELNSYIEEYDFPVEILDLTNLRSLTIKMDIHSIPNNIKNLKNLEIFNLEFNKIKELPEEFGELENLKSLDLNYNSLKKFPQQLANLKKLETLLIFNNNIDDEIPESYNNLSELKHVDFGANESLTGKLLQNEKITKCDYESYNVNVCRTGNEKCINLEYIDYPLCAGSSTTTTTTTTTTTSDATSTITISSTVSATTTTTTTTVPSNTTTTVPSNTTTTTSNASTTTTIDKTISTTTKTTTTISKTTTVTTTSQPTVSGKCGKGIGKCKTGYCCSKHGWCGKTDEYCAISQGCQSEFGDCRSSTTTTISKTTTVTTTSQPTVSGKCGKGIGKCKTGYCCSKYGWCGKTDEYCAISQGCQSEFGDCRGSTTTTINKTTTTTTSTTATSSNHKCGKGVGNCPTGECCSKHGWCGKSYNHCAVSEGCQSEFGLCTKDNTSLEGKCGEGYGKCPSGYCCSKYGWCGKSINYCAAALGCQSKFGKCN